jgi:hypothetical protein
MSLIQPHISWLLLLALGCSQPGTASAGNAAGAAQAAPAERAGSSTLEASAGAQELLLRSPFINEPPEMQVRAPSGVPFVTSHPRGRWRLASPDALGNVVIWADQILIRHDAARPEVSFNLAHWYSVLPAPQRSREQALALAQEVAATAAGDPDGFAQLARHYSEDLPSRDEGGALGSLAMSQLSAWPQVLDAFAAIRPGQTSNVVETYYGFHIFRRREPPPERALSGSHIVIGHDQAEWLKVQARGPLPQRSRGQALALADEVYRQAAAQPERFAELVERFSENRDALLAGDFGSWSTHEPNPFPARLRRLEQLPVGGVGAPVETHLGFEIIQRTEARQRLPVAMRAARLLFDPGAPKSSERSKALVLAQAEALARRYAAAPATFGAPGELPTAPLQWPSGRGVPGVELQLAGLALGEVGATPVQAEFSFQISQRVAPQFVAPERYETELPAPSAPDIDYHTGQMSPALLHELLRASDDSARRQLRLSPGRLSELQALHAGAVFPDAAEPSEAAADFGRVLQRTRALLGRQAYATYLSVLQRELAAALLEASNGAASENGI